MGEGLIYFRDGSVVAEFGPIKAYEMNNELFLEMGPGHNLIAAESDLKDYVKQLWDKPRGNCLEIGLGLGISSRYILSCPRVTSLTTIEKNSMVIKVHDKISPILNRKKREEFTWNKKHRIINNDGIMYAYTTKDTYDFIFIDCYEAINEETLPGIKDMVTACKRLLNHGGEIVGWLDNTSSIYEEEFLKLFE